MTLFVDASAFVAIIAREADAKALASRIVDSADPIWSAMSSWETISSLRRSHGYDLDAAREEVEQFAASRPFRLVAIGEEERRRALDAYQLYGKGRHPARLNMGDCFAYACAKTNAAELLYKGDDFAHTDLG